MTTVYALIYENEHDADANDLNLYHSEGVATLAAMDVMKVEGVGDKAVTDKLYDLLKGEQIDLNNGHHLSLVEKEIE
jgi:hypothetical protein